MVGFQYSWDLGFWGIITVMAGICNDFEIVLGLFRCIIDNN